MSYHCCFLPLESRKYLFPHLAVCDRETVGCFAPRYLVHLRQTKRFRLKKHQYLQSHMPDPAFLFHVSIWQRNSEDWTNLTLFLLYIICRLNQFVTDPGLLLVQGTSLHVLLAYCLSKLSALIWYCTAFRCSSWYISGTQPPFCWPWCA